MTAATGNARTPTNEITRSDAIVLFGASGDLARKMTFISLYHLARRGLLARVAAPAA